MFSKRLSLQWGIITPNQILQKYITILFFHMFLQLQLHHLPFSRCQLQIVLRR